MIRPLVVVFTGKIYIDDVGLILEEECYICIFIYLSISPSFYSFSDTERGGSLTNRQADRRRKSDGEDNTVKEIQRQKS